MNDKTNVYDDEPDARQGGDDVAITMFRPRYRKLEPAEVEQHDEIKAQADKLAHLIARIDTTTRAPLTHPGQDVLTHIALNRGANVTLALRHLEDAVYRAVKALTG